ncbi:hypothetical protein [Bacillus subtilis]|uniref:hypothetical protein n=1 Tax=Bacillus subtilis TaxID=1423 RepID=UPI00100A0B3C|nr:hypothetical protein [Bacillus subtilis]QAW06665.1 hypothetical protein ES968_22140 [Bacillus subtilis]
MSTTSPLKKEDTAYTIECDWKNKHIWLNLVGTEQRVVITKKEAKSILRDINMMERLCSKNAPKEVY